MLDLLVGNDCHPLLVLGMGDHRGSSKIDNASIENFNEFKISEKTVLLSKNTLLFQKISKYYTMLNRSIFFKFFMIFNLTFTFG